MRTTDVERREGRGASTHNGAVWNIVLPPAERILCHADAPPEVVVEAARRGAEVDVVTRCDFETWRRAVRGGVRMRSLWEPDRGAAYDLALLWDPRTDAELRAWLEQLQQLPLPPREVAVRTRDPWRRGGPPWPLVDLRLRRAGWMLGTAHLSLPEADRVRQLVEWRAYTRTPLYRHRHARGEWQRWVTRRSWWRWFLPSRLRCAHLAGVSPAGSTLDAVLQALGRELGDHPRIARLWVSPNGVAIASVHWRSSGDRQSAILKVPYALMAEGRVARNAAALDWLAAHRRQLGRWCDAVPRLLARGSVGAWSFTLEDQVDGTEAQSWGDADAQDTMRHLVDFLGTFAHLGQPPRPLDGPTLESVCGSPVRRVAALLQPDAARRMHALGDELCRRLQGVQVPRVPRHGDFKLENVLGTPRTLESLRILDWELWSREGLPLLDLWHMVVSYRARRAGCALGTAVSRWLLPGVLSNAERRMLERCESGLDPRYVALTPLLYWLDRIGPVAARGYWPAPGWERRNVLAVLDVAEQALVRVAAASVEVGEVG